MRKFVSNWYASQDPVQLARNISHRGGLYGWAHRDLIKLAHIKAKRGGKILFHF
jgi:60 kDa SS-A/Ro ribonucleoprotein